LSLIHIYNLVYHYTTALAPAHAPLEKIPTGVVGWAGTTTEPALGAHDRLNTTDVPEEVEIRPDKSIKLDEIACTSSTQSSFCYQVANLTSHCMEYANKKLSSIHQNVAS